MVISISAHVSRQDDTIDGFSMADIMTFESLLQAAAMRGITVFVSSGDFGAKPPPLGQQPPGTTFNVHWPASIHG
jgi:subtilase family serine protease